MRFDSFFKIFYTHWLLSPHSWVSILKAHVYTLHVRQSRPLVKKEPSIDDEMMFFLLPTQQPPPPPDHLLTQ